MWLLAFLTGCGTSCEVDGPLDYADGANWLCTPDAPTHCPGSIPTRIVAEDGSVASGTLEAASDPSMACFAVYPTLDLRIGVGVHHDTTDVKNPETWARTQAGPLRQVCDLYVPVYRQVIIGTYLGKETDKKAQCFDVAYADVLAAFEAFLAREPERPFALYGHSQGGQHLSRLIRERIETDPEVLARMVVAYPTGWALGTDAGSEVGGSFETVPVCTSASQTGCVVGYRTFIGDNQPSTGRFFEGEEGVCVNLASPDDAGTTGRLKALTVHAEHNSIDPPEGTPDDALVIWEDAFDATCTGSGQEIGLKVEWVRSDEPPTNLEAKSLTGGNGSHILDLNLTVADVVEDLRRRASVSAPE